MENRSPCSNSGRLSLLYAQSLTALSRLYILALCKIARKQPPLRPPHRRRRARHRHRTILLPMNCSMTKSWTMKNCSRRTMTMSCWSWMSCYWKNSRTRNCSKRMNLSSRMNSNRSPKGYSRLLRWIAGSRSRRRRKQKLNTRKPLPRSGRYR